MCQPNYGKLAFRQAQRGVTLIELMIVVSIAALLLMISAPSFNESIRRNRIQSQLGDMASTVSYARSEAVVRGVPVSICASNNGANCAGGSWEDGWIVFADDGNGATAGNGILDGLEQVLRIHGAAPARVVMSARNFPSATSITFISSGRMSVDTGGTFLVCDERGVNDAQALVVNVSGQPRLVIRDISGGHPGTIRDDRGNVITACP